MNMDYSYVDHSVAPHYQLWKPPGAYYTRGEAPPPYEEAIAIAHAESLSSCTVSVATSTGRNFPLGIVQDTDSVSNITANTTNLINININGNSNAGMATANAEIGSIGGSIGRSVATITSDEPSFTSGTGSNSRSVATGGDNSEANGISMMAMYNHHQGPAAAELCGASSVTDERASGDHPVAVVGIQHCGGGPSSGAAYGDGSELCMNSSCELNMNARCNFIAHGTPGPAGGSSNGTVFGIMAKDDHCPSFGILRQSNRQPVGEDKFHDNGQTHRHRQMAAAGVGNGGSMHQQSSTPLASAQTLMQSVPVPMMFTDNSAPGSHGGVVASADDGMFAAKNRMAGKKYHRTIPRQFSIVDPIINPIKTNSFIAAAAAAAATAASSSSASSSSSSSVPSQATTVQHARGPAESGKLSSHRGTGTGGSVTPTGSVTTIATSTTGLSVANRKQCHCPVQHKATLSAYQPVGSGTPPTAPLSVEASYRSLGSATAEQLRSDTRNKTHSTSSSGDRGASLATGGTGGDGGNPSAKGLSSSSVAGLCAQRYQHEKDYLGATLSFSGAHGGKSKQQYNHQQSHYLDHNAHIGASEPKTSGGGMDELMSPRLQVLSSIDGDDRSQIHKKSSMGSVGSGGCGGGGSGGPNNPILPPKVKKHQLQQQQQQQQHDQPTVPPYGHSGGGQQPQRSGSMHQKRISFLESPGAGGPVSVCGGSAKLSEHRKSPVPPNHEGGGYVGGAGGGGTLKLASGAGSSNGYSNSLPRHSFTAARNYERKQRSMQTVTYGSGGGTGVSKSNRHVRAGDGLPLHEKSPYDSNTLPKNGSNTGVGRKTSLVTEAVNHIPSVINIPVPPPPVNVFHGLRTNSPAVGVSSEGGIVKAAANDGSISSIGSAKHGASLTYAPMENGSGASAGSVGGGAGKRKGGRGDGGEGGGESGTGAKGAAGGGGLKGETVAGCSNTKQPILLPLPVIMTTITNCANPREHVLPNDNSLDEDYLSECENCKSSGNTRYYMDLQDSSKASAPVQETMTLQRKMPDNAEEEQQNYYRVSSTLPTSTSKRNAPVANKDRVAWFSTIPASSSSDDEETCE
uniref:Uncharacterized protein n=1 Tax=Anopheles atroparvus TaxID=41427 RepID=A0AAG5DCX6_ANOAO